MFLTTMTSFLKESGMRKVGSCLFIFLTCAFLLLREVLPSDDFVTLTLVVLAGIVGGNAIERALDARRKDDTAGTPVAPAK